VGTIGPNLDDAFSGSREQGFEESTYAEVVRWQIAFPGEGGLMPPDLVEGEDADDVAVFVARCAGNADDPACAPEGGGEITATDGAEIFAQAGCGSCHVLAAAGSTGEIGPNLDEAKPTVELAIDRITNGRGAMPAFGGQLSEEQIRAVAEFVAQSAGG
jgi:cytochrome c553